MIFLVVNEEQGISVHYKLRNIRKGVKEKRKILAVVPKHRSQNNDFLKRELKVS